VNVIQAALCWKCVALCAIKAPEIRVISAGKTRVVLVLELIRCYSELLEVL
jgi:hypothetical protein